MNKIRVHLKAVIISVLLLAIILCSVVLYTMETGKTPTAQAVTEPRVAAIEILVTPASVVQRDHVEAPISTIRLIVDGKIDYVSTAKTTVADFLKAANITLGDEDLLIPSLETSLSDRATVRIITTSYEEETEIVDIPYETEYIPDDSMYEDQEEVEQYGITGTAINTYIVKHRGGKVASRELISSEEQEEAQNQIVRYGTMVRYEEPDEIQQPVEIDEPEETETPAPTEAGETDDPSEEEDESPSEITEPTPIEESTPEPVYSRSFANDYQRYAYDQCLAYGWSEQNFDDLVILWNRESGWNPYAKNSYSGAYGIPQALPGSKMAAYGGDWETNGYVQVDWGLAYIAGRYGNPSTALSYFYSRGWY